MEDIINLKQDCDRIEAGLDVFFDASNKAIRHMDIDRQIQLAILAELRLANALKMRTADEYA